MMPFFKYIGEKASKGFGGVVFEGDKPEELTDPKAVEKARSLSSMFLEVDAEKPKKRGRPKKPKPVEMEPAADGNED